MSKAYLESIKKCSRCGGCQAHCPLYLETFREQMVARGKMELLENLQKGSIQWNKKLADIFSACLLCGSCTESCPNGVFADKLIMHGRKELVENRGLPIIKKNIFQHLLKYNGRLNIAGKILYLYQKIGLQKLLRVAPILNLVSNDLGNIEAMLPKVASGPFRGRFPYRNTVENPRLKVAYFTGCMTNLINHNVGYNIMKLLKAHGVEVLIPEQVCCGVPAYASGDFAAGNFLAQENLKNFLSEEVDYYIFDCATCLSTWLDYPELLETDKAAKASKKLMDINHFLVEVLDIRIDAVEYGVKVTYHDPCHLKRTQRGRTAPRELLKRLEPAYEFVEMDLADQCCGSAGSFGLTHYKLSQQVGKRKLDGIKESKASIVATACPSCMMQLSHVLKNDKSQSSVKHLVEIVGACFHRS
ncbi:(Fe-S)-binding protein [Desulfitibacter alkalitolerans]|uniref:(Fe-S)-binding protein n=1 Tax=Desulfitibacter alkalitolerans TaxID=264641 RepID=UPI00047FE370|nr:(Fe-S)-binding protein [Desulfitibacter alkalitolerans]